MPFTLYDAFVPNCQQILAGLSGLIDAGEAHVKEHGLDDAALIEARLSDTMWTLPWHIRACWMHSAYPFDQFPGGTFTPDLTDVPDSWDAMRAMVAAAQDRLAQVTPTEVDAISDKTIGFVLGGQTRMELKGSDFLMSFNQPNFYFHATTFYDILRAQGVALGKRDFLGPVRVIAS